MILSLSISFIMSHICVATANTCEESICMYFTYFSLASGCLLKSVSSTDRVQVHAKKTSAPFDKSLIFKGNVVAKFFFMNFKKWIFNFDAWDDPFHYIPHSSWCTGNYEVIRCEIWGFTIGTYTDHLQEQKIYCSYLDIWVSSLSH